MIAKFVDVHGAFAQPATRGMAIFVASLLVIAPLIIAVLGWMGKLSDKKKSELWSRTKSWYVLVACIAGPIIAGPYSTILAVTVLSIFCLREYARATGLFREHLITALVAVGILAVNFAAIDNWYNFYSALSPLITSLIAGVAILADRPKGYSQRVALGIFAFLFFGYGFGYMSFMTNDPNYRPILLMLFLTTELNDVFAYVCGHLFGKRKMSPNTSPNKTMGGAIGAIILTTIVVMVLGRVVFEGTVMTSYPLLLALGLIIAAVGQLGDLMLSSIKRDIGIKDLGNVIPGHGGFLDRFDSLVLVTPAVFHFLHYYLTVAKDQPIRIFTGG